MIDLPANGQTLKLRNGATLTKGGVVSDDAVEQIQDETPELPKISEIKRRTLQDVTMAHDRLQAYGAVLFCELWGLNDFDTATIFNTTMERIHAIRSSDEYNELRNDVVLNLRAAEMHEVGGIINRGAKDAARTMIALSRSKSSDIALSASKDVLDRAGFRPADRVEHSHKVDGQFRIVHIKGEDVSSDVKTIDVEKVDA